MLHTRVSDRLADDIRRVAEDLRVPVSNLVRNVLEETFEVVESMSDDVGGLVDEMLDEAVAVRDRLERTRRRRRGRGRHGPRRDAAWRAAEAELAEVEASEGPPGAPPVEWHYVSAGEAAGPVDRETLAARVRDGGVTGDTFVWTAGMAEWRPARQVAALDSLFGPPPVPPEARSQERRDDAPPPAPEGA